MESSPELPSNLGMLEGILFGIADQPASWCIGSFINWLKFGRLNPAMKGSTEAIGIVPRMTC